MRYLHAYILSIAVFLIGGSCYAQDPADSVYTLQQCIDIAIRNNLDVKKSELQMETDRVYWQQARESLLPTFNGNVTHTISNGRSQDPTTYNYVNNQITFAQYNLNGNLILFNGLNLQNTIKRYSLAYQAGKMDFQQAKDQITLNVITTYLQVLNNQDLLTQSNNQVAVSQKQVERLAILNESGSIPPSQYYDLKGQLANDQLAVIDARNALYAAKLNLLQIMNVMFDKEIKFQRLSAGEVPGSQYTLSAGELYQKSLANLALVKAADLRMQSTQSEIKAAKGTLFPVVSLSSTLTSNYSSTLLNSSGNTTGYLDQIKNNYSRYTSIGISIPILNGFQNRNRVALAKIDYLNAKYTNETTKIQLKQNVEQAYVNMTAAYDRYEILTQQVEAFAESFRTAEVRFNAGALTSVDYLVSKRYMDNARTNLISARYDYYIRTKILDYYQGNMSL
ncbi:TolC family protein [Mucilaginibacter robiniae]|uniref:TolC family protein n=1 Tax=Mucilaginibacter robiniae TaxID=2728022 RepID=A0A7L5E4D6_9SPHI|nr:TolC family protein [Mucilaginibacter robiniae]QJD98180.1 TolC family protein [Mucilaginibacter robiniae]